MKQRLINGLTGLVKRVLATGEKEFGFTTFHNQGAQQKILMQQYRLLAALDQSERLPAFEDVGFRCFSQFEEDGILLYIFSLIRPISRRCVEICAGNGRENMTTNLIINHGWWGFLFDGNEHSVAAGRKFFSNNKDTLFYPPKFNLAWVTAENVNQLIKGSGVSGSIDLLSLDMDGNDYWVWKAINVVDPMVVVCETHNIIPGDKALTVPYDPKFVFKSEDFRSASLAAMCKLGREKGYRLIGTHRFGFNAFFLKNGIGEKYFPEVDPAPCLNDPVSTDLRKRLWPSTQKHPWQEV